MTNTIIYTYKKPQYKILTVETNQRGWISNSIKSARQLDYKIELYTDDKEFVLGLDIDKVHYIEDDYQLWDSFKIYILEHREDSNYFLCDNDVIFNSRLPLDNSTDLFYDGNEINNWDWAYSTTMYYLEQSQVFKTIPFWKYDKQPVYNVGILKINNSKLKEDYIYYWKKLYSLALPHISNLSKTFLTAIITQYLLTLLVNKDNYKSVHFTKNSEWPDNNEYYNHYCGYLKVREFPTKTII